MCQKSGCSPFRSGRSSSRTSRTGSSSCQTTSPGRSRRLGCRRCHLKKRVSQEWWGEWWCRRRCRCRLRSCTRCRSGRWSFRTSRIWGVVLVCGMMDRMKGTYCEQQLPKVEPEQVLPPWTPQVPSVETEPPGVVGGSNFRRKQLVNMVLGQIVKCYSLGVVPVSPEVRYQLLSGSPMHSPMVTPR